MATFEKGKGKNRNFWDVAVHADVVSAQEWNSLDRRLRGYLRLGSPAAALAEQARLAREKMGDGFVPSDDAARELAAALPASAGAKKGSAPGPIRCDVHLPNEGTGFLVTSSRLAGKGLEEGARKWDSAVVAGDLLPISLNQDDPFLIRVIVGEPLAPQEEEEWVGRIDARVNVPDGRLVISAAAEFVSSEYEEGGDRDRYVRVIEVPKGHYQAALYACLPGVNGASCLDQLAGGYKKAERTGAWFRRTRPGDSFPLWLQRWCIADPGEDPGHEAEWKERPYPSEDATTPEYVGFILHLHPVPAPAKGVKAPLPPGLQGGWFESTTGARKPDRCPLGLVGTDVNGHEGAVSAEWVHPVDLSAAEESPLKPLAAPVSVEVRKLPLVHGLAWLAHTRSRPALRVTLPAGSALRLDLDWPEGFVVLADNAVIRVLPGAELNGPLCRGGLASLGAWLAQLPDGSVLEMACAPVDGNLRTAGAGVQRYRGPVLQGVWRIEDSFPALPPERLTQALALADELDTADSLSVRDAAEARAILDWLEANHGPYIEDNKPRVEAGVIRLQHPERGLLWLVGTAAFAVRFRDIFPVVDLSDR